jgi:hypothetical protein
MESYFAKTPLPSQETWLGRIQKYFAVTYASAAQAIDYGVVPWSRPATLEAIGCCMSDAMDQLLRSSGGTSRRSPKDSDSALLSEFKEQMKSADFVRLSRTNRSRPSRSDLKKAHGVIRSTRPGKAECLLFARTMRSWYGNSTVRERVTKLLVARRLLGKGRRADTSTKQVHITELGKKVPCYKIVRKRLGDL